MKSTAMIHFWILLIVLTAGCNPTYSQKTGTPETPNIKQETSVASSTSTVNLDVRCLDVLSDLPASVKVSGNLVFVEQDTYHSAYLLRLDGSKVFLPRSVDEVLNSFAVSPNRQWIAYYAENIANEVASRLIIVDANGEQVLSKPVSRREWWAIDSWADNERLLIDKYQSLPDISLATPLPVIVFNPFTGEEYELTQRFPDIVNLYPRVEWQEYGFSATGYDPTLSLVAYARNDGKIVLWDIKTQKVIAQLQGAATFGNGPVWIPDGSRFVIDSLPESTSSPSDDFWKEELYQVDREGTISRITFLTDQFSGVNISGYQWSPDGRHIAMWVSLQPDTYPDLPDNLPNVERLAVLDMETKQVTLFCIPGESSVSPIVWSPDGKQLLANILRNNTYDTVFVDIQNELAALIARNTTPVGWLISSH